MTQISLKSGLKRWGKKGRYAINSEMKQLHTRDTFLPLHWKNISNEQKKQILKSHLLLKEKRDGTIKIRIVEGGNKKIDFISKEDTRSPTVYT